MAKELRDLLLARGAALVGYADLQALPVELRDGFPFGVSIAVALDRRIVRGLGSGPSPDCLAEHRRVNALLDELSVGAAGILRERGHRAAPWKETAGSLQDRQTMATRLPHKTAATRAGLGWIGKTALLITESHGSAIRLTTVFTDAPLPPGAPVNESRCGDCEACVTCCPAGSSRNVLWRAGMPREEIYDAFACRASVRDRAARAGVDRIICGLCIRECPWTARHLNGR